MAGDLIRFVDSIAASPTTRLDLNDEVSWWVKSFSAPPPRLRRSMASNAMRDGINVGSSSYDARTLTIELECRKSTQDLAATEIQKLWRELDRASNFIQYQPNGLTKPVFFRTYRSDASQLADVMAQAAMRTFIIEVLAEPFALGLLETLGPYTVSNNPLAATNPCYVDLPTILGDVAADVVYWDSASGGSTYARRHISSHSGTSAAVTGVVPLRQAESLTLGTDTTNPGGGPDAVMSGTGTNNYLRTSFATNTTITPARISTALTGYSGGAYRVIAAVRRSGASATIKVQAAYGGMSKQGPLVTVPTVSTGRQFLDLGLVYVSDSDPVGYSTQQGGPVLVMSLYAERTGAAETLDWDLVMLIPTGDMGDGSTTRTAAVAPGSVSLQTVVLDGIQGLAYATPTFTDPTTTATTRGPIGVSGDAPQVCPGLSNRLYVMSYYQNLSAGAAWALSTSTTVNLAYWPRYLFVRPVSS